MWHECMSPPMRLPHKQEINFSEISHVFSEKLLLKQHALLIWQASVTLSMSESMEIHN